MYGVTVNKENIKAVLKDFFTLTNIRIAFYSYDQKEYLVYPESLSIFCEKIRKNPYLNQKCMACDQVAFKYAEQSGSFYLYECHTGLYEAISPIILDGRLLGYLMIGQVLLQKPSLQKWNGFKRLYDGYDLDFENLNSAFFQLNYLSREKLYAAVRMMDRSAKYIYFSKSAKIQHSPKTHKIVRYIDENLHRPIKISDISREVGISQSYINQLVYKEFHSSVGTYILKQKMDKACAKLEENEMPIKEIALLTGYKDQNYFSRTFKKSFGMTPSQYREKKITV
jgi:AraC-like DNA-binding protein